MRHGRHVAILLWLAGLLLLGPRGTAAQETPLTLRQARMVATVDGRAMPAGARVSRLSRSASPRSSWC